MGPESDFLDQRAADWEMNLQGDISRSFSGSNSVSTMIGDQTCFALSR